MKVDSFYKQLDAQLDQLGRGSSHLSRNALLFHEIDLQIRIYTVFAVMGTMCVLLGVLL